MKTLISFLLLSSFSYAGNPIRVDISKEEQKKPPIIIGLLVVEDENWYKGHSQEEVEENEEGPEIPKTKNYFKMREWKEKAKELENEENPYYRGEVYGHYPSVSASLIVGTGLRILDQGQDNKPGVFAAGDISWYLASKRSETIYPSKNTKDDLSFVLNIDGNYFHSFTDGTRQHSGNLNVAGLLFLDRKLSIGTVEETIGVGIFSPEVRVDLDMDAQDSVSVPLTGLVLRFVGASTAGGTIGPYFGGYQPEMNEGLNPGYVYHTFADLKLHKNIQFRFDSELAEIFISGLNEESERSAEKIELKNKAKLLFTLNVPIGFYIQGEYNQFWLQGNENYSDEQKAQVGINPSGTTMNGGFIVGIELGQHWNLLKIKKGTR